MDNNKELKIQENYLQTFRNIISLCLDALTPENNKFVIGDNVLFCCNVLMLLQHCIQQFTFRNLKEYYFLEYALDNVLQVCSNYILSKLNNSNKETLDNYKIQITDQISDLYLQLANL